MFFNVFPGSYVVSSGVRVETKYPTTSHVEVVVSEFKALDLQPARSLRAFGELKSKLKRNPSVDSKGQSSFMEIIYSVMCIVAMYLLNDIKA